VLFVTDLFICQIRLPFCYPGSAHRRSSSPPVTLSNYPQHKDAAAGAFIFFNFNKTGSGRVALQVLQGHTECQGSSPVKNPWSKHMGAFKMVLIFVSKKRYQK